MKLLMEMLYDDLDKAEAFELRFTNMTFTYDDLCHFDFASNCHLPHRVDYCIIQAETDGKRGSAHGCQL